MLLRSSYFLLATLLFFSTFLAAQSSLLFNNCYGGSNNESLQKILPTSDSGFIFAGHTWSSNQQVLGQHGARDMWVVKCDAAGQIQWQRCLGGSAEEAALCLFAEDSAFVIGGHAASSNGNVNGHIGDDDFWLVKLRANNTIQWKKCFGGSYMDQMYDVIPMAVGGYLMAGFTFSNDVDVSGLHGPPATWADAWVVKIDAQRNILWQRSLGGTASDAAYKLIELPGGHIIVAAMSNSSDGDITQPRGNRDIWMLKLDEMGNLLQEKNFGGSFDEAPTDMKYTSKNRLLISGYSFSSDGDLSGNYFNGISNWEDAWVLELDTSFNLLWQKNLGGTHSDIGNSILETPMGYLLAAESSSTDFDRSQAFGFKDYWLLQLDTLGNILWEQSFGGNSNDFPKALAGDSTGNLLLGGFSTSGNLCGFGNTDLWVLKLDTSLNSTAIFGDLQSSATLSALPVPFSEQLTLNFSAAVAIQVIQITDVSGKIVHTMKMPDSKVMSLSTAHWTPGLYFIRVQHAKGCTTKKVLKY
ncbi:MAG: T9SS type A sorting domain-containing protein [Bacteroidia bacterium]|nr:T9SS type A sorting domain-containing protein [Bacteroidia bacterium]